MMGAGVEKIIDFLSKHGYGFWRVEDRSKNLVFKANTEETFDANIDRFRDAMEDRPAGVYTVSYSRKYASNTELENKPMTIGGESGGEACAPTAAPAYVGGITEEELNRRLDLRASEIENNYRKAELDRREKELKEERKDYEAERNGTLGILVQQVGKILRPMFPQVAVASTPDEAHTLNTIKAEEQTAINEEQIAADCDKAEELIARFAAVEPQWIELLEAVVVMAENGDSMYGMAKGMLLKK